MVKFSGGSRKCDFPRFSHRLSRAIVKTRAVLERLRGRPFFEKSLLPDRRPLGSGWTMVAYVSTYKSRIVRPPMFSRPHINPGGEKAVHPAIVQWLTPLVAA